jgi:hypothetical protein
MYRYKVDAHCWLRSTLSLLFILAFCISCSNGNSANDPARGPDKPQIPTYDFEWHGVFKGSKVFEGDAEDFSAPQVVEDLVVRGKQQGEYFNVYMEQGSDERDTWVENLIYNGKFYSITHKWHTDAADDFLELCFENTVYNDADPDAPLPITVEGLNSLLASSRFVGLGLIEGESVNHFRSSCLAASAFPTEDGSTPIPPPFFPIKIFSDIYVLESDSYTWTKWLQAGDGVGPDPHNDEWFLFDEWSSNPDDIILPRQCHEGHPNKRYVQQSACKNVIPPESKT